MKSMLIFEKRSATTCTEKSGNGLELSSTSVFSVSLAVRRVGPRDSNTGHRSLITNSGELSHSLHPFGINRPHDKLAPFIVAHSRDVHVLELHETGS